MICLTCSHARLARSTGYIHCNKYNTAEEITLSTGDTNLYYGWFSPDKLPTSDYTFDIKFNERGLLLSETDTCKNYE